MNITFLTSEYPLKERPVTGGIGTSMKVLAHSLSKFGHDIRVILYGQPKDEVLDDEGITVFCLKNVIFKGLSWYLTRKKIEALINKLIKEHKTDLLEAPDWCGITSFIHVNCPIVIRMHGSDAYFCFLDQRPVKWHNKFHEKRALQRANALVSVSDFTAKLSMQIFNLDKDITIIPNAIAINGIQEISIASHNSPTILYYGSLIRKKGVLELPDIFQRVLLKVPNAKLILIGRDVPDIISGSKSTWEMMKAQFSAATLKQVNYIGALPHHAMNHEIANADVCVFPSFAEALPVSWLEAMSLGKSIVASDIGWANEIIDDSKDGYLVNPKEHVKFSDRIVELLLDKSLRTQFGNAAKQKVNQKFELSMIAKKNIEFYQQVLAS